MECSQDVVVLEVNSGLFVGLFLEKKKVQDMIKRLAVSQVTKAGGQGPENTPLQKVYDTDDETAKGK
jgi:hypothetical protein